MVDNVPGTGASEKVKIIDGSPRPEARNAVGQQRYLHAVFSPSITLRPPSSPTAPVSNAEVVSPIHVVFG
jgi:hypothetical protein